jgi:hypothetical protein
MVSATDETTSGVKLHTFYSTQAVESTIEPATSPIGVGYVPENSHTPFLRGSFRHEGV